MDNDTKPQLRPLDFQHVFYQGQPMWYLRDPLQLSDKQLFIPQQMAPLLPLINGRRTPDEIHQAFCKLIAVDLDPKITMDALARLNESCLLENELSEQTKQAIVAEFRAQPFRVPALAGNSYPADPAQLTELLQNYATGVSPGTWHGRGVVSPHIDFTRGGPVYSQVWHEAKASILEADLVIIFGTDHYGGPGDITLTKQSYATPYGVLPADEAMIDKLATVLGPQKAYAAELNHRNEHSVEFSAVWLHHIFQQAGKEPCPMVPILVGSFQHYLDNGRRPLTDQAISAFLDVLREETTGRRALTVASVDLAHVGPAFGDNFTMDERRRIELAGLDHDLMTAAIKGDAESWYTQIANIGDRNRICGFAPTYLMLRYLGESNGRQIAYDQCAADEQNSSLVSICGLLID